LRRYAALPPRRLLVSSSLCHTQRKKTILFFDKDI